MKNTEWLIVDTETDGLMDPIHVVEIAETVERIMADGVVADEERAQLQGLLQRANAVRGGEPREKPKTSPGKRKTRAAAKPAPQASSAGFEIKMACACGQRLSVNCVAGGQEFNCPACGALLRVPGVGAASAVSQPSPEPPNLVQPQSAPFSLVELTQGTTEWLEWRHNGIGASDAPTILGENPWRTVTDLLREKRGRARPSEPNAAMARGTALEPEARQAYISRTGKWVQPACLQSTGYDWLRASVDGITEALDGVVEIKCGDSVYRKTSDRGRPPDYYYGQLQHILAVTGLRAIDFWCYLPGLPDLLVPVERDDAYIRRLLEAEFEFWTAVQTGH